VDHFDKLVIVTLIPAIFVVLMTVGLWLGSCIADRIAPDFSDEGAKRLQRATFRNKYIRLLLFTLFVLYAPISSRILSA
jgi:hypothetical protein